MGAPRGAQLAPSGDRLARRFLFSAVPLLCNLLPTTALTPTQAREPTNASSRVPDLQFGDLGPVCVSTSTAAGFIGAALFSASCSILQVAEVGARLFTAILSAPPTGSWGRQNLPTRYRLVG